MGVYGINVEDFLGKIQTAATMGDAARDPTRVGMWICDERARHAMITLTPGPAPAKQERGDELDAAGCASLSG